MENQAVNRHIPQSKETVRLVQKFPKVTFDKKALKLVLTSFVVVLLGIGTGWFLSGGKLGSTAKTSTTGESKESATNQNESGSIDESDVSEKESPEGILLEGGIKGEGTHHLDRGLGESKYVYLTSTAIDLQGYVGKKVKVWGETVSAVTAGWLMDVEKIKVL